MNDSDQRPRIRPAVTHKFDGSTYYEYLAARERERQQMNQVAGNGGRTAQVPGGFGQPPRGIAHAASNHNVNQPYGVHQAHAQLPDSKHPNSPTTTKLPLAFGAGAVAIVLIMVFALLVLGPSEGVKTTTSQGDHSDSVAHDTNFAYSGTSNSTGVSGETTSPQGPDPASELAALSDESRHYVTRELDGKWVVQLSAKQEGLTTDGKTWDHQDILDEYQKLKSTYGNTLLIRSSEWSSFRLGGYWVTILDTAYDSPDPALAVCRELGRDRDSCFAKLISSTASPDGSTVLNDH